LGDHQKALKEMRLSLKKVVSTCLGNNRNRLTNYQKMIDIVHPVNTMKRGFSITRTEDGKVLKNIHSLRIKEKLTTEVTDGLIRSEVKQVTKNVA